jgi:polyisoprenoid-binding protein YceI
MLKPACLIPVMLGLVAQAHAGAEDYHLEKTHVDVMFGVSHLGFTQKHGSFRDLVANLNCDPEKLEACRVEVVIRAESIDTGFEARDKDVRGDRFLDTAKYPEIRFVSRKVVRSDAQGLRIEGDLTLHGVTKPFVLKGTLNKAGANPFDKRPTLGFSAQGTLKRSEFGVSGLLPMIGDEVSVTVDAEFNRPAPQAALSAAPQRSRCGRNTEFFGEMVSAEDASLRRRAGAPTHSLQTSDRSSRYRLFF